MGKRMEGYMDQEDLDENAGKSVGAIKRLNRKRKWGERRERIRSFFSFLSW